LDPASTIALFIMVTITGGLMNAVQTTMYALAAHVYPTEIRATGVGTAVAVGRVGHVLSAYVGAWAMDGGQVRYFGSWAIGMAIVFCTLALVGRHIERADHTVALARH
jgi:AAHS family 4-hydroxybenzoate transporter-like MFS transporter